MRTRIIIFFMLLSCVVKAQLSPEKMVNVGYKNPPIGILQPTDSTLIALGKLQSQINALKGAVYNYIGHGNAGTLQSDNTAGASSQLSPLYIQWLDYLGVQQQVLGYPASISDLNFYVQSTTNPINIKAPNIKLSGLTYSLPTSDAVSSLFIVTPSGSAGASSFTEYGFNGFSGYLGNARIGAITGSGGGGDLVFQTKIGTGSIWTNQVKMPRAGGMFVYNMPSTATGDSLVWYNTTSGLRKGSLGTSLSVSGNALNTIQDIRTSASPQFTKLGLGVAATYVLDAAGAGASLARFATSGTSPGSGSSSVLIDNSTVNSNTSASFALQIKTAGASQTQFANDGSIIRLGSTSGSVTYKIPATITSYSLTAVNAAPATNGQSIAYTTGGTGSWITPATLTGTEVLTNKDLTSGTNTFPTFNQNTTGSAAKWTTGRTISLTGDIAYTSPALDGSGSVTAAATLPTVNSNVGTFNNVTVNGKGLVTAASNVAYLTNPMTTAGDIIYGGTSGIATRLPISANGYFLQIQSGLPAYFNLFASNNIFTAAQTINGSLAIGASGLGSPVYYYGTSTGYVGLSASTYSGSTAYNQTLQAANGVVALTSQFPIHGNSTTTGTATTVVTVTIGSTMANTTYNTTITPRDLLTAVNYYISAQTTTTFDVTFISALTGSINFDYNVTP